MPKHHSHTMKTTAVERYVKGASADDIAAELKVSPTSVRRWIIDAGHRLRSRGDDPDATHEVPLRGGQWVRDGLVYRWAAAMNADPMLPEAIALIQRWEVCSRRTFQRHMRVGWVKRDTLLHQLEDRGHITFATSDRERFRVHRVAA